MAAEARISAVLGPTNTGKTHYAIERMLAHRTGVIGLPLRLLAREVYDRVVAARGPAVAALITGEERIIGERAHYWICTTEAMPTGIGADFVAIDEIQLCADPDRGHVFTDRLLNARGLVETLFLGAATMRGAIAALVPGVQFLHRERFSQLSYTGSKKISRMPARSAIVSFSVENLYAIAELIRRQKGGCAVVMGALSPRTRNAQVELYQNGDVDFLVATDAIGMGLNLDIGHVAFSATTKFDGHRMRGLFPHELGQIAGRAGRYLSPGSFGVTGEARALDAGLAEAVENHRFSPIQRLMWRAPETGFASTERLIAALETAPDNDWLARGSEADDLRALKTMAPMPEIRDRVQSPKDVRLLWDVCRIPDFRAISGQDHATLLARIFGFLQDAGHVPDDWLAGQIRRIDRTEGDIDTLSRRLAHIRTWTYVAQRQGWVGDENHWRGETRAVEDRLSDALHARLTQAFVDRRTSVLMRRLKQKESLVAEVNDKGEVTVEGEFVGRLEGFRFRHDATADAEQARTLRQAAYEALRPEFHLRADRFYNAPDTEFDFTEQGGLMWGANAVGKLVRGAEVMRPGVEVFVDEEAGFEVAEKVRRRLQHFIDRKIAALYEPLLALTRDEALTGLARGFAFRLGEALGVLPREGVAGDVKALDQEARGALRRHGVRFGQYTIFLPALLKPAPTRLRLVLWSLFAGLAEFPESPPPGLVTIPNLAEVPAGHYTLSGYHPAGSRAIRIDMLERLADILRNRDSRAGFEAVPEMLSITGMTLEQFADLMTGLGYRAERGEREKTRAEPVAVAVEAAPGAAEDTAPAVEGAADGAAPAEAAAPAPNPIPEGEAALKVVTEAEVFYTFTWAPRPRGPRGEGRGDGRAEAGRRDSGQRRGDAGRGGRRHAGPAAEGAVVQAAPADGAAPTPDPGRSEGRSEGRGDRSGAKGHKAPRGGGHKGGGPRGERDRRDEGGRGGPKPEAQGARRFEARPEPKERHDRIDPDNPFVAALMALRDKI